MAEALDGVGEGAEVALDGAAVGVEAGVEVALLLLGEGAEGVELGGLGIEAGLDGGEELRAGGKGGGARGQRVRCVVWCGWGWGFGVGMTCFNGLDLGSWSPACGAELSAGMHGWFEIFTRSVCDEED